MSIEREYRASPEREQIGNGIEYQNQIPFGDFDVNLIHYTEKKVQPDEKEKVTEFAWITSAEITPPG